MTSKIKGPYGPFLLRISLQQQARLFQIQLIFNASQHLIADLTRLAHLEKDLPLGRNQLLSQPLEFIDLFLAYSLVRLILTDSLNSDFIPGLDLIQRALTQCQRIILFNMFDHC